MQTEAQLRPRTGPRTKDPQRIEHVIMRFNAVQRDRHIQVVRGSQLQLPAMDLR